jgi:hypothetical protein
MALLYKWLLFVFGSSVISCASRLMRRSIHHLNKYIMYFIFYEKS